MAVVINPLGDAVVLEGGLPQVGDAAMPVLVEAALYVAAAIGGLPVRRVEGVASRRVLADARDLSFAAVLFCLVE